jgi:uncharacterized membrane protein YjgN (DUF898 family)
MQCNVMQCPNFILAKEDNVSAGSHLSETYKDVISLSISLHYIALHYIALHYIALHYITLHYITPLHHISTHHISLHHTSLHHHLTLYHMKSEYFLNPL